MKVDFSKYKIPYCIYCDTHKTECPCCVSSDEYYSVPSLFTSHDQWICKYVEMLSEFSNLVHNLGFKVR